MDDNSATMARNQEEDSIKIPRKDLKILIRALDRRIHRAIELDQLVTLSSEMLKEKLNRDRSNTKLEEINETLERISSSGAENGQILHVIRIKLKALLNPALRES